MIKEAISKVVKRVDLSEAEMVSVMNEVMTGSASPAQISSFITALRMKGETAEELTGAARVMRKKATQFNISTVAAFATSACALTVAKHGNKSVSSKSGSADVLKALGVNIEAEVSRVEECFKEVGIGFLFAPLLHGAMKYAVPVRREIGIRTIFNLLGPLTNPAGAQCQVVGVYDPLLTDIIAKVLFNLGSIHAFVVCGEDGLDEITLTDETRVTELKGGNIKTYHIKPEDFGFERCTLEELKGGNPDDNARIILDILEGKKGPQRDVVLLNAAAAITAGGKARNLDEGVAFARGAIDSGEALKKLEALKKITNR
jgi:anthranilate phosphoribosyltransferase